MKVKEFKSQKDYERWVRKHPGVRIISVNSHKPTWTVGGGLLFNRPKVMVTYDDTPYAPPPVAPAPMPSAPIPAASPAPSAHQGEAWYLALPVILAALVVLPPIGIILLWTKKPFPVVVRVVLTIVSAGIGMAMCGSPPAS